MAKLVLVNHWSEGIGNNKLPLGLGYLAAYLKKYLNFHDLAIVNTGEQTFEKIAAHQPEIVGLTAYTAGYYDVVALLKRVKQELGVFTVIGGPHVTCLPQQLPAEADIGVVGEGEETLLELIKSYEIHGGFRPEELEIISGIVYWDKGILKQNPPRAFITPLDKIPPPDRELLNIHEFLVPTQILMTNEYVRGATMLSS
ncbi:cobalamin-dependent protein, partial [candidate division KSB1 bacterium]|nr:cobalamin-dependent protein [candidate division KSB1 bacterium]